VPCRTPFPLIVTRIEVDVKLQMDKMQRLNPIDVVGGENAG